ncbi:MAG: hypothetical protein WC880_04245 [Candidatus Paceibacterota bacterium]
MPPQKEEGRPAKDGLNQNSLMDSLSAPIKKVLPKLEGVKGGGGQWTARCPSHEDKRSSLSVSENPNGKVLLHCHAGCDTETIVAAIDLEVKDLFQDTGKAAKRKITAYDYVDEQGSLLYQVVRYRPKDFRQRRPDGNGDWTWNLKDTRRVLYRLPQVLTAVKHGKTIFVVEGEKDSDALRDLGFVTTCNAGGAGKWLDGYSKALNGAHVVILPDNDEPGRKHAEAARTALEGGAASVKVLQLPGLPEKGDVSDWIAAGGTAEKLDALMKPASKPATKRSPGRMLRQAVSQSKKLAALSQDSLALFFLLIPHFNNHGKMAGNPFTVKGTVAPLIAWLDVPAIERCLSEISEKTNVKWFQYEGLWYLQSLSWREHQELREDRLGKDHLPNYPGVILE